MTYKRYEEIENATVVPAVFQGIFDTNAAVYTEQKKLVLSSIRFMKKKTPPSYINCTEIIDKEVIFINYWDTHFGHFLEETISSLWLAKEYPHLPIIIPATRSKQNFEVLEHQKNILDLLGIKNEFIYINNPNKFKKVYVPNPLARLRFYITPDYLESLQVYDKSSITPNKKIYLSRANITSRGYINENEIEDYAKNNGYTIIYPEKMALKDLLNELASAEKILSIEGSALYNLCFIKNFSGILEIIPRMKYFSIMTLFSNFKNAFMLDIKYKTIERTYTTTSALISLEIPDLDYAIKNKKYLSFDSYKFKHSMVTEAEELQKTTNKIVFSFVQKLEKACYITEKEEKESLITKAIDEFLTYYNKGEKFHKNYVKSCLTKHAQTTPINIDTLIQLNDLLGLFSDYMRYLKNDIPRPLKISIPFKIKFNYYRFTIKEKLANNWKKDYYKKKKGNLKIILDLTKK